MTTTYTPTTADIETACLVLADVIELSDSLGPEQAVEFRIAAEKVRDKAKEAIDYLNMQLVKVLEGQPNVVRGGRAFYVSRKKDKDRYDHSAIAGHVVHIAVLSRVDPETGEAVHPDEMDAARNAVQIMSDIYLSDSTTAKVGQLDRYGIPRDPKDAASVRTFTRGDKCVVDVPASGTPDSEAP